jgi:tryptophan synthase beta subunit
VPANAVLVDATQDMARGAAPAVPGETGRALLWSGSFMARKWGYDVRALTLRETAASALGRGHTPVGPEDAFLRSLEREAWVIASDDSARAANPAFRVVARAEGVVLARFSGR